MIKAKKIASGYYEGRYNYVDFTIQKVSGLRSSEVAWYWQIGNEKVNDWYRSKFQAIQAVKSYIDVQKACIDIIDTTNEPNILQKMQWGGVRKNAGNKPKYNEKTTTAAFRCPLSKVDELKLVVKSKLSEWSEK